LIPYPILKVLSTFETNGVQHLLMGGQACVLYGAAEFSRDMDIAVVTSPANSIGSGRRSRKELEELRRDRDRS
jgi:hypothetical protein